MNFITFVFSLLLILSFGSFTLLEKKAGDKYLRETYLGHIGAHRKILSRCESEIYKTFPSHSKPTKEKINPPVPKEKEKKIPLVNPECARLNLWPLIQEGREEHPFLFDTALSLLKSYYGPSLFSGKPQEASLFLIQFLKRAKEAMAQEGFSLEKLDLAADFRIPYYKMLKGTKEWNFEKKIGYPPLLDVIKAEEKNSKICLFHAHPGQISVLFGPKAAIRIFEEIHKESPSQISKEQIEQICSESHVLVLDPSLFDLIDLKPSSHPKQGKMTWVAVDKDFHISLRKTICSPRA